MANLFDNLPALAGNGVGAAVDLSTYGATKTFIVSGVWDRAPIVTIEMNDDAGQAGSWAPVGRSVQGVGQFTISVVGKWFRVKVQAWKGGLAPDVNVGGTDLGTLHFALVCPAGVGNGAAVDISTLGPLKTACVQNAYRGALIIEFSTDGASDWSTGFSFPNPGQKSGVVVANWARVKRLSPGTGLVLPLVFLYAEVPAGGGGPPPTDDDAVIFDDATPGDNLNIRSDRAADQSPIDNTLTQITNFGSADGSYDPTATGATGTSSTIGGGNDHSASGDYSTISGGAGNIASGYAATIPGGESNLADGTDAYAEGALNTSSGTASHAEGQQTAALGNRSHAEGYHSTASGNDGSHAEGYFTTASAPSAHAEGRSNTASGTASHAEGSTSTATADSSHAEGSDCHATAAYAHAEGQASTASGSPSHAEGSSTASGSYSHAEGGSTATASASHSEGSGTQANGVSSHAEGLSSISTGQASHAEGNSCASVGASSHAEGESAQALRYAQHSFASGAFVGPTPQGSAQTSSIVLRGKTPGVAINEAVVLFFAGDAGPQVFSLEDDKAYACKMTLAAGGVQAGPVRKCRTIIIEFIARRAGGVTTIAGSNAVVSFGDAAAADWTLVPTVGAGPDRIIFTFTTGAVTTLAKVAGNLEFTEILFA